MRSILYGIYGERIAMTAFYLYMAVAVVVGVAGFAWSRYSRQVRDKERLLENAFGEQFLVEVTIVANEQRLGRDQGVLWFADGLMGFSGEASSFVLAAADLSNFAQSTWRVRRNQSMSEQQVLYLKNAPVPSYLIVQGLGRHNQPFRDRYRTFWEEHATPDGERVWPPLVPF